MNAAAKTPEHIARIARLNDRCRTALGIGAKVIQTEGISALPSATQSKIREAVETFKAWTPDNDPHGEHDFGSVEIDGYKVFWKIDYYDLTYTYGSDDPADPAQTRRVLTIMLAEEY
jgi:hypothetical protein